MIRLEDRTLPETLDLPSGDFVGSSTDGAASITRRDGIPYDYALFRDGLALLGGPSPRHIAGHRIWHPKHGLDVKRRGLPCNISQNENSARLVVTEPLCSARDQFPQAA